MKRISFYLIILITIFYACNNKQKVLKIEIDNKMLEVSLEQYADSYYAINMTVNHEKHNEWALPYPVYRFDYADITGDGIPEIAVGVIKTTRFDPHMAKRLFIFKITDDYYIRPLWLGSRVAQPLEDFCFTRTDSTALIRTIEKEQSGDYLVAEYRWRGFGLEFIHYIEREISLYKAQKLLQNK